MLFGGVHVFACVRGGGWWYIVGRQVHTAPVRCVCTCICVKATSKVSAFQAIGGVGHGVWLASQCPGDVLGAMLCK